MNFRPATVEAVPSTHKGVVVEHLGIGLVVVGSEETCGNTKTEMHTSAKLESADSITALLDLFG